MKTCIRNPFPLPALIAVLGLILAGRVAAQTFTTLHNFVGSDGENPQAGLIISGNTLYGACDSGGGAGIGDGVLRQHQWHGLCGRELNGNLWFFFA